MPYAASGFFDVGSRRRGAFADTRGACATQTCLERAIVAACFVEAGSRRRGAFADTRGACATQTCPERAIAILHFAAVPAVSFDASPRLRTISTVECALFSV